MNFTLTYAQVKLSRTAKNNHNKHNNDTNNQNENTDNENNHNNNNETMSSLLYCVALEITQTDK